MLKTIINFSLLSSLSILVCDPVFAVDFSPYTDLTVNVDWNKNEPQDLVQLSKANKVTSYHLAFITDGGNCAPVWGTFSAASGWASDLTDRMRASNINYTVSFGGLNGIDLSHNCDATKLANVFQQVITTYKPQGLDFDIENGSADIAKTMSALKTFQAANPKINISFTLPVMPEGLTPAGLNIVKQAQNAGLKFTVNIMTMDYGSAYISDMGQYATEAATALFKSLKSLYPQKSEAEIWQMIEVTPMIGVNDTTQEQFTLADTDLLVTFAKQHHINKLAMWSVARDVPCAINTYTSAVCSGNNLQSQPNEFALHFLE